MSMFRCIYFTVYTVYLRNIFKENKDCYGIFYVLLLSFRKTKIQSILRETLYPYHFKNSYKYNIFYFVVSLVCCKYASL